MLRRYACALLATLCASSFVHAQATYPNRPVRVIVPWTVGGSNDISARLVMKAVGDSLGQNFIIDNRPGAAGTVGANAVAKAPPDGYTLMVHSGTHIANEFTYKDLPYDTLKDFAPVASIAGQPLALAVASNSPYRSLKELLARAKAEPGKVSVSSSGVGSAAHLQIVLLQQAAGVDFLHVPYKGGNPQAVALIGGETDAGVTAVASMVPSIQGGRVRLLAITSNTKSSAYPNVPTLAEEGVKGFDFTPWIAVFAPAGTPDAILAKLHAEVMKALQRDDVKQAYAVNGIEMLPLSREQFAERVRSDYSRYSSIIGAAGKKLQE